MILSLGHVIPIRSRVPLVRALPYILKEFPDAIVLIVGEVYCDDFRRVADELGVSEHVVEAGAVAHAGVAGYLAAATVASHDLDGHMLGISTLETMAAGIPVFSRVRRDVFPGIDLDTWPDLQVVEHASPEEIAESICDLLRSGDLCHRVVEQQLDFVNRHFRSETVAAQYLTIFEELAGVRDTAHTRARVCVAIPFFSNLGYLDTALRSLIAQTDRNWTAIVVDDASPEPGAGELVAGLDDDRVRYVRNDTNLGVSGNFNRCLQLATDAAEIVTIFHADDMLGPGYVAAIRSAHETFPTATCIAPWANVVDGTGRTTHSMADSVKRILRPLRLPSILEGDRGLARLMHGLFFYCPAVSYRVDLLPTLRFDERWKQVMDLDLFARILLGGGSIAVIPDRVYCYRRHGEAMTTKNSGSSVRASEEKAVITEVVAGGDRTSLVTHGARRTAATDHPVQRLVVSETVS